MSGKKEKKSLFQSFFSKKKENKDNATDSDLSPVGLYTTQYRSHHPSSHVTLEQIKTWSDFYTEVKSSDKSTSTSHYDVNEFLNQKVSLWVGDITTLKIDAIVNSASHDLVHFGEVGERIHLAAGPELANKCASIGLCEYGKAVITKGYRLHAKYIIHTVVPRMDRKNRFLYLKKCYRSCLDMARDRNIKTVAFPSIGTQYCGFAVKDAAQIAVSTTREWLLENDNIHHIERIIFSVITVIGEKTYRQTLKTYFPVEQQETVPQVISVDPHALSLYQRAIKEGKECDPAIRVNIVGNYGQGKSSLKRRLVGHSIEGVTSTNGIDVARHKFKRSSDGRLCLHEEEEGREIVSRVVEIVRKAELESSLEDSHEQESVEAVDEVDAIPIGNVVDLYNRLPTTDVDGLINVQELPNSAKESNVKDDHSLPSSEGNNNDLSLSIPINGTPRRVLSENEMISFINDIKISDSKKASDAILDFWDFGGQYVFYATHTMFHSQQAIYLLVFDLTTDFKDVVRDEEFPGETGNKTVEYFIRFWMNSIHSFVGDCDGSLPRVILVGTHKDKIKAETDDERTQICEEYFDKIRQMFEDTTVFQHIHQNDFAVDNVEQNDEIISRLLEEIVGIGDELSKKEEIPAQWLPLERELKKRRSQKLITLDEILHIDATNEFPLSDEDQVKLFLRYHHSKGTLFYFDEEPIADHVILDPQYLIDAFRCIITSKAFCKNVMKCQSTRKSFERLVHDGKLENALIDKVWDDNFIQHKDVLLGFLKKHYVISEAMKFDDNTGKTERLGWYIVPSLLKDHISTDDVAEIITDRKQSRTRFVMLFEDSSLLQTIFSRLMAALLGKWSLVPLPKCPKKHTLFENLGMFQLDKVHLGLVEVKCFTIELLIIGLCISKDIVRRVGDRFRRYCESVIGHEFECLRTRTEYVSKPYKYAFRCNHTTHGIDGSKGLIEEIDDEVLPCPDLDKQHDVFVKSAKSEWFLQEQVDTSNQNKGLTDKKLSNVAKAIGNNWQLLGVELKLTQTQIDQATYDGNTMVMKVFNMLMTWKRENVCHDMNVLGEALNNVKDRVTIDWDVIRNICDSND
ncbi:uncharacterized protein LOC132729688 [Ruditapes philippinarum]|uniref:uncharacterized protein LOC132729688 n=1 Tax=Ruditapes philippinarum TaxID=129788 RepID=UPI00295AEAD5|nr:uncharacterized protein LOC132729688 [Ruditapes philippinarum]